MVLKIGFAPLNKEPGTANKLTSAGLGACIAEAATFPLDMAKVRLMIQGEGMGQGAALQYRGLLSTITTVAKSEGPRGLYAGIVAGFHRQLVVGSIRIGLYDTAKHKFGRLFDGEDVDIHHASIPTRISAGITTGVLAICFGQPTDVVKVRMQAQGASGVVRYSGALSAYAKIAAEEGVSGLWKGLSPNAVRTAIVNAAEIVSYDLIKSNIVRRQLMSDNAPCHFVSALAAALVTTIVSSPVDVLKTRYMNSYSGQYKGLLSCGVTLWREKGPAAFYKGCVPSFWRLSSWNILMFMSYEQIKRAISHGSDRLDAFRATKLRAFDKWD